MKQNIFNSRYPILEACMNGCSNLDMALAVEQAGGFASYWFQSDLNQTTADIEQFKATTGHNNIVIGGVDRHYLQQPDIVKTLYGLAPSHIEILTSCEQGQGELLTFDQLFENKVFAKSVDFLRRRSKILVRLYSPTNSSSVNRVDGLCIKGQESAGKSGTWAVNDLFQHQQTLTPNLALIPYGGVGTPQQVRDYVSQGAAIVAVGTVLAATKESCLSALVKQKIIESTWKDITKLQDTGQNSLVLNPMSLTDSSDSDWNRGSQLMQGIKGDGTQGLLYMGRAIDQITSIKTVKEVVEYLAGV